MSLVKVLILLLFLAVLFNLAYALIHMFRRDNDHSKMAKSLTWRIGISIVLFILILVLIGTGQIDMNPSPLQTQ